MFCITCSICETTHDVTLYTKQVDLWALSLEFLLEFQPRPNQKADRVWTAAPESDI